MTLATRARKPRRTEWIEPDRWHQTVCNFLQLLAWEARMEGRELLYPTARLQLLRDIFFAEWQLRSQRLGRQLQPLYYPECFGRKSGAAAGMAGGAVASSSSAAPAPADGELSEYEKQRNANILDNQARLCAGWRAGGWTRACAIGPVVWGEVCVECV